MKILSLPLRKIIKKISVSSTSGDATNQKKNQKNKQNKNIFFLENILYCNQATKVQLHIILFHKFHHHSHNSKCSVSIIRQTKRAIDLNATASQANKYKNY